jgi:chromosome segregation ATPase
MEISTTHAEHLGALLEKLDNIEKSLINNHMLTGDIDRRLDDFDYQLDDVATKIDGVDNRLADSHDRLEIIETKLTAVDIRLEAIEARQQLTEDSIFNLQNQQQQFSGLLERSENHLGCAESDIKEIYDQLVALTHPPKLGAVIAGTR